MNQSSALVATTIKVVDTPQMVCTNSIMTTHVNKTTDRPLMNSMVIRKYRSADVMNPRGGYRKLFAVIAPILHHKDGHYGSPNMVALKYFDFRKKIILMSKCSILQ